MPPTPDYFVAPFAPDGEMIAVAGRSLSELSPRWLGFWHELLATQGPVFRCAVPLTPLQHITVQLTSGSGAALVTLSANDQPASSSVALTGSDPARESEVLRMWVDSLRRVPLFCQAATSPTPFSAVFDLVQRPLYVVIPWANPRIRAADQQLVQELENHLAGALLAGPAGV